MRKLSSYGPRLQGLLHLLRTVRFVWQSSRFLTLANSILLLVQGVLPLAGLYLMKLVIDEVSRSITAPDKEEAFERVLVYIALAGGVILLGAACNAVSTFLKVVQSELISDRMHHVLHAKSTELDLHYYENSDYYDTLHRTKQEAPYRPTRIVNGLIEVGQNAVSLLAIIGLLFALHWTIPAFLFFATLPGALLTLFYIRQMHKRQSGWITLERRSAYLHTLLMDELNAKEIRFFNLGDHFMGRYNALRKRLREERLRIMVKRSAGDFLTMIGGTLAVFGSYTYLTYQAVNGRLTLGDLVMYLGAFQRGGMVLRNIITGAMALYENNLFLSTFYEFLEFKRRVVEPSHPKVVPCPIEKGIAFEHVSFRYPTSDTPILDDINIDIKPGEIIGLVGENGSGKTTLIKLLCRFYDPITGRITIDGTDLRDFETAVLRRHISVVFQDYKQYYETVRQNIWFGDIERSPNDDRIVQAAKYSDIDRTVRRFKQGYDTPLGKMLENGEELSIGQTQKLAVARGLFRDAQVMVLDEPTSAMDAKAEFEVFKRFQEMAQGRTVILISHRLSTLRMANCIYVMKTGRIVERGCHRDLMQNAGTYADLFEIQAQGYRYSDE